MNLLISGDLHLTDKKPENRTDNWFLTQYGKMKYIFKTAEKNNCAYIIQPGDMFDSYRTSEFLKQHYIQLFLMYKEIYNIPVITIYGQHDMKYHSSNREDTTLKVLQEAKAINLLSSKAQILQFNIDESSIFIYGCAWDEEIPNPVPDEKAFHILIMHKMVIKDKLLFPGQTDFTYSKDLLSRGFDLIVSGDNHNRFVHTEGAKTLINCGSLMRANSDQANHKPAIYIFDTDTRQFEEILIPIQPFESVMNLQVIKKEKEISKELELFVSQLVESDEIGLDFKLNLKNFLKTNTISLPIQTIIRECLYARQ